MKPTSRPSRSRGWIVLASLLSATLLGETPDQLKQSFLQPPPSARPQAWWHWMNGSVTKEGITADLEALAQAGIGGVQVFDTALIDDHRAFISSPVEYLSPAWQELRRHALTEAARLGLEVAFHICAGYSESGGPWVKPENSMQHLVWNEIHVTSGGGAGLPCPLRPSLTGFFKGRRSPGTRHASHHNRSMQRAIITISPYWRFVLRRAKANPTPYLCASPPTWN